MSEKFEVVKCEKSAENIQPQGSTVLEIELFIQELTNRGWAVSHANECIHVRIKNPNTREIQQIKQYIHQYTDLESSNDFIKYHEEYSTASQLFVIFHL